MPALCPASARRRILLWDRDACLRRADEHGARSMTRRSVGVEARILWRTCHVVIGALTVPHDLKLVSASR